MGRKMRTRMTMTRISLTRTKRPSTVFLSREPGASEEEDMVTGSGLPFSAMNGLIKRDDKKKQIHMD